MADAGMEALDVVALDPTVGRELIVCDRLIRPRVEDRRSNALGLVQPVR